MDLGNTMRPISPVSSARTGFGPRSGRLRCWAACTRSIPRSMPSCACSRKKREPPRRPPMPHARAATRCRRCRGAGHHQGQCRPGRPADRQWRRGAEGFRRPGRSPVVADLKHAGAIIIGRTNAPAFSMRIFTDNALHGRTRIRATPRSRRAVRAAARERRRRPASAPSRTATISAARSASGLIATASSDCVPASAASPPSTPAPRGTADRRRADGVQGPTSAPCATRGWRSR